MNLVYHHVRPHYAIIGISYICHPSSQSSQCLNRALAKVWLINLQALSTLRLYHELSRESESRVLPILSNEQEVYTYIYKAIKDNNIMLK